MSTSLRNVSRVLVAVVALTVLPSEFAVASSAPEIRSPVEHDDLACLEAAPSAVSLAGATDDGDQISLDVLVLLDGLPRRRGIEVMSKAAEAYAPLGVRLRSTFRTVHFPTTAPLDPVPKGEATKLFEYMIEAVGGARPRGSDLVYLMTNKDVYIIENGERNYALGGIAYCIGGVRFADAAFALGEGKSQWEDTLKDSTFSGKLAAHEIGHVMGAHHHYGNCVEGNGTTEGGGEPSICTLMWPYEVAYGAINFGTLESAVVRGHAVRFASP